MEKDGMEKELNLMMKKDLNRKRAKGKKVNNGIVKFEGEYKDGERNGKGKEYYNSGDIEFKGEYKDDEKNGMEKDMIIIIK